MRVANRKWSGCARQASVGRAGASCEPLEARRLLTLTVTPVGTDWYIDGDASSQSIVLRQNALNSQVELYENSVLRATFSGTISGFSIDAKDGNDVIDVRGLANPFAVELIGSFGNDTLWGGVGNDSLYGDNGNDFMDGGAGADFLSGGRHADEMYGGSGNDTMEGNAGGDFLYGNDGDDRFNVGDGEADYVNGGAGNDAATTWDPTLDTLVNM